MKYTLQGIKVEQRPEHNFMVSVTAMLEGEDGKRYTWPSTDGFVGAISKSIDSWNTEQVLFLRKLADILDRSG